MREFGAILGLCIVLRIAQSFFESEPEALDVEAESCVSLAVQALAKAHFGQSFTMWPGAPQKRHRFLSRQHCLSFWVSLPSFLSFEERSGLVFFCSEELPLLCEEPED